MRILVVSQSEQRVGLHQQLEQLGHGCDTGFPLADAGEAVQFNGPYDAVILHASGIADCFGALRDIRRRRLHIAVVVVAARMQAEDEQMAFHLGADDVLAGPLSTKSLVARLQAIRRRGLGHASATLSCGNVVLDQGQRDVTVDGRRVPVTAREFDVLETLMLHRGVVLTKEQFLSRSYGLNEGPNVRILDVFICKLRRKLSIAGAPEIIRTVWGSGFVLQEPSKADMALARQRHQEGTPRQRRAHMQPVAGGMMAAA
jgi:two-component system cell cycle response regulator CtrA